MAPTKVSTRSAYFPSIASIGFPHDSPSEPPNPATLGNAAQASASTSASPSAPLATGDTPVKNTHALEDDNPSTEKDTTFVLKEARADAVSIETDFYLGQAATRERLSWYKDGRRQRLVGRTVLQDAAPDEDIPDAILSVITHITKRDCYLGPEGGWTSTSMFAKKFSETKLTFTGCAPANAELGQDFATALANLENLMNRVQTTGAEQVRIFMPHLLTRKIKFRHSPFAVCALIRYSHTWLDAMSV